MATNSSGQISYLVLESLASGSKYGLEIIEHISQKTGGNYILKKPTLYSCLTRMEKKGQISSSYWGESDLGGKRHYYTITPAGRKELENFEAEYSAVDFSHFGEDDRKASQSSENAGTDTQYVGINPAQEQNANAQNDDLLQDENGFATENISSTSEETQAQQTDEKFAQTELDTSAENAAQEAAIEDKKPVFLQQDNLFDTAIKPQVAPPASTDDEEDDVVENQIDMFSYVEQSSSDFPQNDESASAQNDVKNFAQNENNLTQNNSENSYQNDQSNSYQNLQTNLAENEQNDASLNNQNATEHDEKMQYYQSKLEQTSAGSFETKSSDVEKRDDARLLDDNEKIEISKFEQEQNQRLYDTSTELKKYRNKKSFSENQIEMSVVYQQAEDPAIQRAKIEELKKSMLEARQKNFMTPVEDVATQNASQNSINDTENADENAGLSSTYARTMNAASQGNADSTQGTIFSDDLASDENASFAQEDMHSAAYTTGNNLDENSVTNADENASQSWQNYSAQPLFYKPLKRERVEQTQQNEEKDDAVLITQPRIKESEIPIQKKILPPNIEVNIYDDNLPAPKRDSNLEPTYKDMMAKLFERKKEKSATPLKNDMQFESFKSPEVFADYANLKRYYAGHGIEFKEYKKSTVTRHHNTNFLKFIGSAFLLLLAGVGSAILFGIISAAGLLRPSTNFMFYTLPALFLVFVIYSFLRYKFGTSKKAVLIYNQVVIWSIFVLASVIVFVINIMCGMQAETMATYLTSILVPIWGLFVALPINFYVKKFLYKKYAK